MQQHLTDRSKNPQIDNWQRELQVNGIYLKRRDPIHPYGNFYGVHLQTKTPHSQSTRATIISVATYNFKQRIDGEAAAFIVCLDDESPSTTTEHCNNFLLGDPSNRWSDKSVLFAICRNGLSGDICEHSMLDALSLKQLNRFITKAILLDNSEPQQQNSAIEVAENLSEEFTFEKNEVIDAQIERIQKRFKKTHVPAEAAHLHLPTLGHSFLESHKISPKTGYQLIVQLASLLHFGEQFPSWEVLTLMPFHKGRLDWMQVVSPAILAFCRAAAAAFSIADNKTGLETSSELKMLLREAAMVHVCTMTRIARGRSFAAHMEALHEIVAQVLPDDDDVPPLFRDQTWEKIILVTNTRKIKTDAS
ncbi:hypothetical protein MMC31_007891 [Peltigera leucophlebia]|nr:hypothetical protein [Peltigera leucophlebia]